MQHKRLIGILAAAFLAVSLVLGVIAGPVDIGVGEVLRSFAAHLHVPGASSSLSPTDNAILAGVERLIEQPDTDFLLAAPDDDAPPLGVAQLRYRFCIWTSSPDCWLEDLFVDERAP